MTPRLRWLLFGDGASIHTRRLAQGLVAAGVETHLASFEGKPIDGVTSHQLHGPGTDVRYATVIPELRKLLRQVRPDVLNAHYLSSYGLTAAAAGHRMLVQTVWGSDVLITAQRQPRRAAAAWALRRAQLATGCSEDLLREVGVMAPGLPGHRFIWAPPRELSSRPRRQEPIVLSPRSLKPLYQVEVIIRAWKLASPRLPGVRLMVAGGGSQMGELRHLAGADVEFTGLLDHRDMLDLISRSRVVVSIPKSDASSAAVLEALSCGCSVVASDTSAMRELVAPERLVPIVVEPGSLADVIVEAYADDPAPASRWDFEGQIEALVETVARVAATPRPGLGRRLGR